MMHDIVLHPRTRDHVTQFVSAPSHAVLLVGAHGIGKTYLAHHIVAPLIGTTPDALRQHPYYLLVSPTGATISIDTIRELQRFLQLKTIGNDRPIRRTVIIEHADALTTEAQNAFLKLLEEPPADTLLLLTTNSKRSLLPTILSRSQAITLYVPHEADVKAHFKAADETTLSQAYFLSGGLPGLMHALVHSDTTHPLMSGVATAKQILQKQTFERLTMVESMSKNKEEAGYVLDALLHIAQTGLNGATAKADLAKLKQWHHILKVTHEAKEALRASANPKLTLSHLMLSL